MQLEHSAGSSDRIHHSQEERVSSVSLLSHAHTSDITNSLVWIDPVVQQHISASAFIHETSHDALAAPVSRASSAMPRHGSAYLKNVAKVRLDHPQSSFIPRDTDVMRIPIQPQPTLWQYDTPNYEVASSLSSLSLIVTDMQPTVSLDHQVQSPQAGHMSSHHRGHPASALRSSFSHPLYHLRWWLLISGHLEVLLCCSGTLLFASIICIFLFLHHAYWL